MRLVIDSLIALMLVTVLAGVVVYHRRANQSLAQQASVREALAKLHEQALYHGALTVAGQAPAPGERASRFPVMIDPAWFGDRLPLNALAPAGHPWIDLAPPGDEHRHPPDPVLRPGKHQGNPSGDRQTPGKTSAATSGGGGGGFWYNPNRGIFRARVPDQGTDRDTLALYNRINNTALHDLDRDPAPDRQPLALHDALQAFPPAPGSVAASDGPPPSDDPRSDPAPPGPAQVAQTPPAEPDPVATDPDTPKPSTEPRRTLANVTDAGPPTP